ncbi:hypothetical protein C8F01DRAFT_1342602 [Mycena amicta]|nr:hypothetical protein C8F01DRAFT_1342602 [Mycena amicta]
MANGLKIFRLVTLSPFFLLTHLFPGPDEDMIVAVSLFALISIGMGGALTPLIFLDGVAGIAITAGIFTLLTVPTMLILEWLKPGVMFTSTVVFEVVWLTILSILWLATGGVSATFNVFLDLACETVTNDFRSGGDSDGFGRPTVNPLCNLPRALTAFGFLNWVFRESLPTSWSAVSNASTVFFYVMTLMIMSCVAANRNQVKAWTGTAENLVGGPTVPPKDHEANVSRTSSYPPPAYPMYPTASGGTSQAGSVHHGQ